MGHSHKAHDIHPKKVKVDVLEVLRDLWEKEERYELELRQMESKTKESKPEPERQLRGRRLPETVERGEMRHCEAVEREERFF